MTATTRRFRLFTTGGISSETGGRTTLRLSVPPAERDWGTAAAVTAAVLGGAHIVRVHAVTEMVQVVRVAEATRLHGRIDNGPIPS